MNALDWFAGHFSNRGKALSLFKRGIAKEKKHNNQGAIDDFTTTIGMPHAPTDVKAMALYNRALVYAAAGEIQDAAQDMNVVLAMIDDYTTTISMPNTPADVKATALYNRGLVYAAAGEVQDATEDINVVLAMIEAPTNLKTEARRKLVGMQRPSSNSNMCKH